MDDLIGLAAVIGAFSIPVFFFLAVVGIVAISLVYAYRKKRMAHEQIKAAIERGATGEELERIARVFGVNGKRKNSLLSGIIILAWGLGLGGFFMVYQQWGIALLLGLPITITGAAKIIYWVLRERKREVGA